MAATLVKSSTVATADGVSSVAPAFGSATVAGNLLVAPIGATTIGSGWHPVFPAGWVQATTFVIGTTTGVWIFYYPSNPGGITTVTINASSSFLNTTAVQLFEFNNAAGTLALDQTGTNSLGNDTTAAATLTAASANAAANNELAVAIFDQNCRSGTKTALTPSATTGFTQAGNYGNNVKQVNHISFEYKLDTGSSAGAAVNATETFSPGVSGQDLIGAVALFAIPAAPAATTPRPAVVTTAVNRAATR